MVRIFISGPMSRVKEFNRPAFYEAEKEIRSIYPKAFIFNPARLNFDDGTPKDYMTIDLSMLNLSTHIYMLIGWEKSKGAKLEHDLAQYYGMTIVYQKEFKDAVADIYTDF